MPLSKVTKRGPMVTFYHVIVTMVVVVAEAVIVAVVNVEVAKAVV